MQTFTFTAGSWTRRLMMRNPLMRTSDRVQAVTLVLLLALALAAVPIAGAVGTAIYDARVHAIATERLSIRQVTATAIADSVITRLPYQSSIATELQWQDGGRDHRAIVDTDSEMKAGGHTEIWIDSTGAQSRPPLSGSDAATEAIMSAFLLISALAVATLGAWTVLGHVLDRGRFAAWDRELDRLTDVSER